MSDVEQATEAKEESRQPVEQTLRILRRDSPIVDLDDEATAARMQAVARWDLERWRELVPELFLHDDKGV